MKEERKKKGSEKPTSLHALSMSQKTVNHAGDMVDPVELNKTVERNKRRRKNPSFRFQNESSQNKKLANMSQCPSKSRQSINRFSYRTCRGEGSGGGSMT